MGGINKGIPHDVTPPLDGCKLHPHCQTCPYDDCKIYNMPSKHGEFTRRYEWRRREARKLHNQKMARVDIALIIGVTPPQVYKYIKDD